MPKHPRSSSIPSDSDTDVKPTTRKAPNTPSRKTARRNDTGSTPIIEDRKPNAAKVESRSPKSQGEKGQKTAWTAEEDTILVGLLHDLIKSHLWGMIKADGRLVGRTSYGAQYHARMLLAKGTNAKPSK